MKLFRLLPNAPQGLQPCPLSSFLSSICLFTQPVFPQVLHKHFLCVRHWRYSAEHGACPCGAFTSRGWGRSYINSCTHYYKITTFNKVQEEKNEVLQECITRANPSWRPAGMFYASGSVLKPLMLLAGSLPDPYRSHGVDLSHLHFTDEENGQSSDLNCSL